MKSPFQRTQRTMPTASHRGRGIDMNQRRHLSRDLSDATLRPVSILSSRHAPLRPKKKEDPWIGRCIASFKSPLQAKNFVPTLEDGHMEDYYVRPRMHARAHMRCGAARRGAARRGAGHGGCMELQVSARGQKKKVLCQSKTVSLVHRSLAAGPCSRACAHGERVHCPPTCLSACLQLSCLPGSLCFFVCVNLRACVVVHP